MTKLIVKVGTNLGDTEVFDVPGLVTAEEKAAEADASVELYSDSTITAEMVAEQSNVTDTDDWAEVEDNAFTSDEFFFGSGFTVVSGVASWSPEGAREFVKRIAKYRYLNVMRKTKEDADVSEVVLIAQASLSTGRDAAVQAVLDDINTHLTNSNTAAADADAATTAAQLKTVFDGLPADPYAEFNI